MEATEAQRFAARPLFAPPFCWTDALQSELASTGHVVLPGVLTPAASAALVAMAQRIDEADMATTRRRVGPEEVQAQLWAAPTEAE
jgi:hypothetical protein